MESPEETAREDTQQPTEVMPVKGMKQYHNMYNLVLVDDSLVKVFVIRWTAISLQLVSV